MPLSKADAQKILDELKKVHGSSSLQRLSIEMSAKQASSFLRFLKANNISLTVQQNAEVTLAWQQNIANGESVKLELREIQKAANAIEPSERAAPKQDIQQQQKAKRAYDLLSIMRDFSNKDHVEALLKKQNLPEDSDVADIARQITDEFSGAVGDNIGQTIMLAHPQGHKLFDDACKAKGIILSDISEFYPVENPAPLITRDDSGTYYLQLRHIKPLAKEYQPEAAQFSFR